MLALVAGGAIATAVLAATQRPGPGLDPDAMAYTGAATSLVRSGTFRVPTSKWSRPDSTSALSFWPPGYPAVVALPVALGISAIQGARIVDVAAAGVSAIVLFFLIDVVAGVVAACTGVVVVFATPAVLDVHLSVLSEPLFLALLLLTVAAMVHARGQLILLGALSAATVMVRYAGACAPAAAVIWTLGDARYSWPLRFRRAAAVAVLPALALGAWFARTALTADRHGTPHLAVYGGWGATFAQAGDTVAQWLAPAVPDGAVRTVLVTIVALIAIVLVVATVRETFSRRSHDQRVVAVATLLRAAGMMLIWYLLVVGASRLLVGGTIPFDERILAPAIVLVELALVVSAAHWWSAQHRPARIVAAIAILVWLSASVFVSQDNAVYAATEGSDFANTEWRDSPTLAWVRAHGQGHTLFSNWPPALYFHTGRVARDVPDSTNAATLRNFAAVMRASHGFMVGFTEPSPDVIAPDSLARLIPMREVARFPDGAVWAMAPE